MNYILDIRQLRRVENDSRIRIPVSAHVEKSLYISILMLPSFPCRGRHALSVIEVSSPTFSLYFT